jgi:hypothetical protein
MFKQFWQSALKKIQKRFRIIRQRLHNRALIKKWLKSGSHYPPPHEYLEETLKSYAIKFNSRSLVETGTYLGATAWALQDDFDKIYTIELNIDHYLNAREKFHFLEHIEVIKGESSEQLATILENFNQPVLFWLDTHAWLEKGLKEFSILKELKVILSAAINHVILINDARLFTGENGYPSLIEIRNYITSLRPEFHFEVEHDIIRVFVP